MGNGVKEDSNIAQEWAMKAVDNSDHKDAEAIWVLGICYERNDVLNMALFGMTAKEWRDANKSKTGNIRDYATINQLLVLANIESYNAILINQDKPQSERLVLLREMVKQQLKTIGEKGLAVRE